MYYKDVISSNLSFFYLLIAVGILEVDKLVVALEG